MKKIVFTNGIIAGVIVSLMLAISHPLIENGTLNYDNGMIIGYASMVIALSVIFFAIKSYRDQHRGGSITFGQGFKLGILIALIAAVIYALFWEVYYNTVAPDYLDNYTTHYLNKLKQDGANESEVAAARAQMESFNELYKNPLVRFAYTLLEILPVGIVITLVSAAILRKRQILSA
jgi:hypothetical protein